MSRRWIVPIVCILGSTLVVLAQQGTPSPTLGSPNSTERGNDFELVEKLIVLRRNYQRTLEQLRWYYLQAGDQERGKMAEDELINWHRIKHYAYIEQLDVPPPNLKGEQNVTDANNLITRALQVKDKGWGVEYIDNQRRAEILFQELITKFAHSNKISEAAFYLGEIYESKANDMYRRAAWYYTRSYQWNAAASKDALLRSARIYHHKLHDTTKALEQYREVTTSHTVPAVREEARKAIAELSQRSRN